MKKKIFAVALVVMLLVGGLILASCSACPGMGGCEVKFVNGDWNTNPNDGYSSCEKSGCAVNNREGKTGTLECDC